MCASSFLCASSLVLMCNCDGICRYRSPWVVSAALEAVTLFQNERTGCQQCSFHGIASSESIADPYT